MAYLSLVEHISDGSQTVFNVPFPYINRDYVHVFKQAPDSFDREAVRYLWQTPGTLQLQELVPAGWTVRIQRITPEDRMLVTFSDESYLMMKHLDLGFLQVLHLAQEADDQARSDSPLRGEMEQFKSEMQEQINTEMDQFKNEVQEQIDNVTPDIGIATTDTLGLVRVDGSTIHVDAAGVLRGVSQETTASFNPFFSYVEADEAVYLNAEATVMENDRFYISGGALLLRGAVASL